MDAAGSDPTSRYEMGEPLRTSSVSQSIHARDLTTGAPVTVTRLNAPASSDATVVADVQAAAQMLGTVPADDIARIVEVTTIDGQLAVVTDGSGGTTLAELMSGGTRFPSAQAAQLGRAIANGLDSAHRAGVVHGALTPNAIIRATDGHLKVADFGFARNPILITDSPTWTAYAAPEQIMDGTVDARSDIYALGSLLYLMLTGRAPFAEFDETLLRNRKLSEGPTPPSHEEPMIPPAFDALVTRMLARDPAHRPQSGAEVAAELARFEETVVAAPVGVRTATVTTEVLPIVPVAAEREQPSALWWLALAAVVVAGIITAVLLSRADDKERVAVPTLVGLPADRGAALLQRRGLAASTVSSPNDSYPAGVVVAADPVTGAKVAKGTVVILSVSSGPTPVPTTTPLPTFPTTTTSSSTTTTTTTSTTTTTLAPTPPPT